MSEKEKILEVKNVTRWYTQKIKSEKSRIASEKKTVKALDGISFQMGAGETLGIIGESGCGKSTLGRLLIRLEDPTSGSILLNGVSSDELLKNQRMSFRRMVQMVFQNPFDTFEPRDSIEKILISTLKLHKIGKGNEERHSIIVKAMEEVGLLPVEDYLYRFPHELSGGQLQRVSILRSMLLKPILLVADEPVSMLDVSVRADVIKMLMDLVRNNNTALVFISHDINITRYISDRVAVMYLGRIVETGNTDMVLHDPKHPYTKVLISNCGSIDPNEKREIIRIEGEPPTPIDNGPGCYFAPRCYKASEKCFAEYPKPLEIEPGHIVACHFLD